MLIVARVPLIRIISQAHSLLSIERFALIAQCHARARTNRVQESGLSHDISVGKGRATATYIAEATIEHLSIPSMGSLDRVDSDTPLAAK